MAQLGFAVASWGDWLVHVGGKQWRLEAPCGRVRRGKWALHGITICARLSPPDYSRLTSDEFDAQISSGELHIAFVGMSNCGKSYRSKQLASELGFALFCVDDEIEHAIAPELAAAGYSGIEGMAQWMGFPTDQRFLRNQQVYLEHEETITAGVEAQDNNFVLDTTGSVIHLSKDTLKNMGENFLVVHLEAGDEMLETMVTNYFASPKPVIWGDSFERRKNEEPEEALRRCYPKLLIKRREKYREIAHLTVPGTLSLDPQVGCAAFMNCIRDLLARKSRRYSRSSNNADRGN